MNKTTPTTRHLAMQKYAKTCQIELGGVSPDDQEQNYSHGFRTRILIAGSVELASAANYGYL